MKPKIRDRVSRLYLVHIICITVSIGEILSLALARSRDIARPRQATNDPLSCIKKKTQNRATIKIRTKEAGSLISAPGNTFYIRERGALCKQFQNGAHAGHRARAVCVADRNAAVSFFARKRNTSKQGKTSNLYVYIYSRHWQIRRGLAPLRFRSCRGWRGSGTMHKL